jgi:hypothetical protein
MDAALFDRILTDLGRHRLGKVCMYLMNEPLADPEFFGRLAAVRDRLRFRVLEVSTNAAALNAERAARLAELLSGRPHEIWISFHGICPESYRRIMGLSRGRWPTWSDS